LYSSHVYVGKLLCFQYLFGIQFNIFIMHDVLSNLLKFSVNFILGRYYVSYLLRSLEKKNELLSQFFKKLALFVLLLFFFLPLSH
jgi:hypothetical protein